MWAEFGRKNGAHISGTECIWARTEPKTEKAVHQPAAIVKGG